MKNIIEIAKRFDGVKETGNNGGFSDPYYETLIRKFGWVPGQSWCAYAQIVNWNLYFEGSPMVLAQIKHVLHPHVLTMWGRAKASSFIRTGPTPEIGSIAVWKLPHITGAGHCGIVTAINKDRTFETREGNTSEAGRGNQANGDGYYTKQRTMRSTSKWELRGFIYLPEIPDETN